MADHHHHQHRPNRLSVPSRTAVTIKRAYPTFPFTPTPTPTPSKTRLSFTSRSHLSSTNSRSSISFLFLILFSLRSFYSLLPFLRSFPSFSLFPFSFLVSLLSFLLTLVVSLLPTFSRSTKDPFFRQNHAVFSLSFLSPSQRKLLFGKSLLLAVVFLLRFQALRYCGAAAMILAQLSGTVAARYVAEAQNRNSGDPGNNGSAKIRGFCLLFVGLLFLSISWDRIDCFPLSSLFDGKWGFWFYPRENCTRIWPMLLPFLSGFLGCYEKLSTNWGTIRQLDRNRIRLLSLFLTTVLLFIPALVSFVFFEGEEDGLRIANWVWPLANTVVFGVLLSENYSDDKSAAPKDFEREFLVTFFCTIVLELFYFPELSLWGLLLCGLLLYFALRDLDSVYSSYQVIGLESPESFSTLFMKPVSHILSERKSRKIALFLLINTGYMVVEFVAGFMSNSLGLISDACHMLFDCAALAIGLYASYISRLPANNQFNFGRGRFEVLSGYVNAVFLVLVGALIVLESLERILDPQEISTNSLLIVSIGGLVVNVVGLIFFHEEHHHAHGGSGCTHSHSHHHHDLNKLEIHECGGDKHHKAVTLPNDHSRHHHHHEHDCVDDCGGTRRNEDAKCDDLNTHDHHTHEHEHHRYNHNHNCRDHGHDHSDGHRHQHHHHGHDCSHGHHCHDQPHDHHEHDHCPAKAENTLSSDPKRSLPQQQKHHHHHIDHNMEGIFLHVLADTMGSVGVVISTLLIKYKGWLVADPVCSIFISVLIVSSVISLLRNSAEILLQRVPRPIKDELREAVRNIVNTKGVCSIQNLHVWSLTNTDIVGTLHLLVSEDADKTLMKTHVSRLLEDAGVKDLTLQVECAR